MNKAEITKGVLQAVHNAATAGRGQIHEMMNHYKCLVLMGHNAETAEALYTVVRGLGKEALRVMEAGDTAGTCLVDAAQQVRWHENIEFLGGRARTTILERAPTYEPLPPPNSVIFDVGIEKGKRLDALMNAYESVMGDATAMLRIATDVSDEHAMVLGNRLEQGSILRLKRFNPLNPKPKGPVEQHRSAPAINPAHFGRERLDPSELKALAAEARAQRAANEAAGRAHPKGPDDPNWSALIDPNTKGSWERG